MKIITAGAGKPDLSVILTSYQQETFIGEAVRSLLNQAGIVAEIILSDDASTDRTFAMMAAAVKGYDGPHRVLLRCNRVNAGIDHVVQLVELASCDIIVNAHGDNINLPERCRRIMDEMHASGASVLSSNALRIDRRGNPLGLLNPNEATRWLTAEEIIRNGYISPMIGATLSWKREAYSRFPRLDSRRLAIGHDTIVPFRGSLLGGMRYLHEPLIRMRQHKNQWSKFLPFWRIDGPTDSVEEGFLSYDMTTRMGMLRDLRHLAETSPEEAQPRVEALQNLLNKTILEISEKWVGLRDRFYMEGWRAHWIEQHEFDTRIRRRLRGLEGRIRDLWSLYARLRYLVSRKK
jgi:glycosyltransferase involved in cell wall biosynthesis